MAAVKITRLNGTWAEVILDPPIDGTERILINYKYNVVRVTLLEDAEMVKIFMNDKEVMELHYALGVEVDGVLASSNQNLVDLIKQMFLQ